MTSRQSVAGPDQLRGALRDLRAERARITWWRRLVRARLDLAVAGTAGPQPLGGRVLETMRDAGAVVPDPQTLATLLIGAGSEVTRLVGLRELDATLGGYERQVDGALDEVRDRLVEHLALDPEHVLGELPDVPTRFRAHRHTGAGSPT